MMYFLEAVKEDPNTNGDMQLISVCKNEHAQLQSLWLHALICKYGCSDLYVFLAAACIYRLSLYDINPI